MAPSFAKKSVHRGAKNTPRALSSSKANAAGFAKRRARSVKAGAGLSGADVYDYMPTKSRRANVALELDEDESRGAGYGDDDDEEEEEEESRARRKPRLIGEGEQDERIGSDDDEEIDSDGAFEESDEERFAEFSFKKKVPAKSKKAALEARNKNVRFAEVDLDEDDDAARGGEDSALSLRAPEDDKDEEEEEEEEEEGDDDEFLDVLDVLDGRGVPDLGEEDHHMADATESSMKAAPRTPSKPGETEMEEEAEEDDEEAEEDEEEEEDLHDDEDEDAAISGSDEDEADPSALETLGSFVSGLETGSKRKATDEGEEGDRALAGTTQVKKKKRLLKDRTESGIESEFGARTSGALKLSLDDLLTPLTSRPGKLSTLKKSMKPLADSSNPKNQPLAAPLPTRTQEKLDREAAYEQTKQEVDKWSETMKRIREAEHLSFPLQAPKATKVSNFELTSKFKPTTELESSIDRLLKSAKLREEDINKTEDLLMKDLSVEEVTARRTELRQMRELAFRADAKAKRVAKIKSKAFRRIRKKEHAKVLAKLDGGEAGNGGDPEEERLKAEVDRAKERATLKHKNTGKWARSMQARGELDTDQRRDINEMLERGERLRRRIQGAGSGSEDEDGEDSSDDDPDGEDGVMRIKANAFNELDKLRTDQDMNADGDDGDDAKINAKGVFQMKFMKDAAARKNQDVNQTIDDFRKEIGEMPAGSEDEADKDDSGLVTPVQRVNGRMIFRPGPQVQTIEKMLPPPPPSAISETSTLRSHDSHVQSPVLGIQDAPAFSPLSISSAATGEVNPWLSLPESADSVSKPSRRKNELLVGRDVARVQKSEVALQKQLKKSTDEREKEKDDAVVEIAADDVLVLGPVADKPQGRDAPGAASSTVVNGKKKKKEKKKAKGDTKGKGKNEMQADEDDSDANSEVEEQEAALTKGKKVKAFEQRELVARAFAGDNVVRQFEEAKRKEIESDAPKEVDTTLPGWGSWGGSGTKNTAPKAHLIKKVAGIDPRARADYGKAHVIISERRDKKATKYAVKDLPYPYTSKAQFEASMSVPLGVEWNTRLGFQRGTLPRVVKKMGTVIDPLEKL